MTPHPLANTIPDSNTLSVPALRSGIASRVLQDNYDADGSQFVGAFCAENDNAPTWAKDIARYDRDAFHRDANSDITLFSELPPMAVGEGKCFANFRHALDLWIKGGRKGPMPYSEYQKYGSCVNASFIALLTMALGVRASDPAFREVFAFAAAWYHYANRGYCSDGWNMWGLAKVAYEIGFALRQAYSVGSVSVDFTDNDRNEKITARDWCRSGVPKGLADHTQQAHPFEPGSIVEFDGGVKELLAVFAAGGGINTGGTNTSGGSRPFTIGRVGPHEQCGYGADDSEEFRKFCRDVIGVAARDNDFPIVMDQTWGEGFNGECADKYWPVGTAADGRVVSQADVNQAVRAATSEDQLATVLATVDRLVLADTWGWGLKPQGAWVWWASDILRYFRGDIFALFPRFKGVPNPNPAPKPTPVPVPVPMPVPVPNVIEIEITQPILPGKYILFPKSDI